MRYIVETTEEGNEARVWATITKLQKENLISIVEKGDPVEEMKEQLRKITRAMQVLTESGISNDLMTSYIADKTKLGKGTIRSVLDEQNDFYKKLGVKLK